MVPARVAASTRLAVLCGPTAVGKTALGVALARRLEAEIVCADSRTVYCGLDIGTAKPDAAARRQVPHHLLDVVDPAAPFTLADFQHLARRAIAGIHARERLPLIVGGTGLYIRAIVDDLTLPAVPPNHALRSALEAEGRARGPVHLHRRLAMVDPVAAGRIHPHNLRRVIRALEVTTTTGRPISALQRSDAGAADAAMIGLTMERAALYARIDARVEAQLAAGLVEETRALVARGLPASAPAMQGLGYKEIGGWLRGEYDFPEAVRLLKRNTRRYAKRQLTWFGRDGRIRWLDASDGDAETLVARARAMMETEFASHRRS